VERFLSEGGLGGRVLRYRGSVSEGQNVVVLEIDVKLEMAALALETGLGLGYVVQERVKGAMGAER
jgi:hypothetical protein